MNKDPLLAARLRQLILGKIAVLILALVMWRAQSGLSVWEGALIGALTLPFFIALPSIVAGHRRTYAWMTLAVTPFIVVGITEAVANPESRAWAGVCLFLGFALFVLLVAYLRATREPT
jgi:uncharacterized membrane protein